MDVSKYPENGEHIYFLIFAFLQADCGDLCLQQELFSLGKDLNIISDKSSDSERVDVDNEGIESDGHLDSNISLCLDDILPLVDLQGDRAVAAALLNVAESLRNIADQFEDRVVNQATQSFRSRIEESLPEQWAQLLKHEVQRVINQGVGLENFPQERVIMACAFTLVKGVFRQAPRLLRNLCHAALVFVWCGT
ncbi:hypothetical protein FQA47_008952 [Oryzias melastigma]|uniref:BH3-interacting domain death agonist n=1 Tax=Oryzias melastigma TaxID=30732 RepID=A0A834CF00_ORYME|nr:hypothetical protein FQA47_008952 [Oryzias melastigma]